MKLPLSKTYEKYLETNEIELTDEQKAYILLYSNLPIEEILLLLVELSATTENEELSNDLRKLVYIVDNEFGSKSDNKLSADVFKSVWFCNEFMKSKLFTDLMNKYFKDTLIPNPFNIGDIAMTTSQYNEFRYLVISDSSNYIHSIESQVFNREKYVWEDHYDSPWELELISIDDLNKIERNTKFVNVISSGSECLKGTGKLSNITKSICEYKFSIGENGPIITKKVLLDMINGDHGLFY